MLCSADALTRIDESDHRMPWRFDDECELRIDKHERLPKTGWLRVDAVIGKVGVNRYVNPDGSERFEARLEEEVFDESSMRSFELVPLTNMHPRDDAGRPLLLDSTNTQRYQVGSVGNVRRDGDLLLATLLVTDHQAINDIFAGKRQLSPGYRLTKFDRSVTEFRGQRTDGAQRGIVGNHEAFLFLGRQGHEVAIRLDEDDRAMPTVPVITITTTPPGRATTMKITIDGVEYEVKDDLGAAVNKLQARCDAAESKQSASQARVDALESENKQLKGASPEAVAKRADLLANARRVCGDDYSQWGESRTDGDGSKPVKSDIEVMRDVVLAIDKDAKAKLDERRDDASYVECRYDMALIEFGKRHDHGEDLLNRASQAGKTTKPGGKRTDGKPKTLVAQVQATAAKKASA